jgi:hypothetical protein
MEPIIPFSKLMGEWNHFAHLFGIQSVIYCKVNFALNLTKYYIMKTYGAVNV